MKPLMEKRLDAALAHFHLKDQAAATKAGLHKDFIRNIRRGKSRSPRTEGIQQLAEFFQCSADWLSGHPAAEPPVWAISDDFDENHDGRPDDKTETRELGYTLRIEELDVRGSAGPGLVVDRNLVKGEWQFPRDLVRQATQAPADRIKIITILGDSLEPIFRSMERVMVDTSNTTPSPPGYFVVYDGLGQVVKRVEYIAHSSPPRVKISSVNPDYAPYERTLDEAYIQGRVLGKWNWT